MDPDVEFRRLYEAHRTAVHAYFVGRTAHRGTAADLTQEVFVRVWRRVQELVGMTADEQRGWIFTVARNLSIDAYRNARTRAETEVALAREPAPTAPPVSGRVLAAERVSIVGEAINRLPETQRVTLTMAAAGGLTSAEIAAVLKVPAGTVRYRLSLARRSLAETLAAYDEPTISEEE